MAICHQRKSIYRNIKPVAELAQRHSTERLGTLSGIGRWHVGPSRNCASVYCTSCVTWMGYVGVPRPNSTVYLPSIMLVSRVPVSFWTRWPSSSPSQMSVIGDEAAMMSFRYTGLVGVFLMVILRRFPKYACQKGKSSSSTLPAFRTTAAINRSAIRHKKHFFKVTFLFTVGKKKKLKYHFFEHKYDQK